MEKSILEMVGGEKHLHYDVDNKAAKEYTTLQERIEQLEEINSDLKQSLDWANEREKENTERIVALEMYADLADEKIDELKEKLAGAERTRNNLRQIGFPTFQSCKEYADKLNYAKTIIQSLLDNSDEYARQRAIDFLKEVSE